MAASPALALDPQKSISQFTHTAWSAKDGLPGPVRAITQTADGYLWLGTEAGLYRFDGLRFVPWESAFGERLPSSSVWALLAAHDGSLWIGFGSSGISRLQDGRLKNYAPNDGIPSGGVLSMVEDANGSLWAGGQYGFGKFSDGVWHSVGAESEFPAPGTQALFVDRQGKLWVATDGFNFGLSADPVRRNTILTLAPNEQRFVATGEAIGLVWTMAAAPNGDVWIADASAHSVRPLGRGSGAQIEIPGGQEPMCVLFDSNGSTWVGLLEGGICRALEARPGGRSALDHFQPSDGLSGSLVYSSFKDREGNIWLGTTGGLDRFRENKVTPFSASEGLDPDQQIAVTSTPDGRVWIVNYTRDFVRRFEAGNFVSSKLPAYSTTETTRILSLFADASELWVGGNFKLAKEANGEFSYAPDEGLAQVGNVEAIAKDATGDLWIATTEWVTAHDTSPKILRRKDGKWTDFSTSASLPKYRSRVMYGDREGRMWIGFESGELAVYEHGEFRIYSARDGLPSGRILTIASDRRSNVWLGGEGGVSRFHQGRFTTLTKDNGLPGSSVSAIIEDDDGSLWLACALGIFRVSQQELEKAFASPSYHMEGTTIAASDGLRGLPRQREPFPTAARAADGRLWFATAGGIAVIDPRNLPKNLLPPPVRIESIKADDEVMAMTSGMRLRPKTKEVEFQYAALSLTDPERVQFRYKLEGYDDDWRGPVSMRQIRYTNLAPGNYSFRVIASNNDGVWNETGATWNFAMAPAFYQTIWFRLASLVAVAGFFVMLYQIRLRRVKRHNAALLQENSERKRAEAALQQTRTYMAASESLSLTGSFRWNLTTGELSWSDEVFRIFGWDLSTKPTLELIRERIHPEDLQSFDEIVTKRAGEMKDFEYGHRIVMPDGSIKHLEVLSHAVTNEAGTIVECVGAVKDVTERKRAEALLTGEKELLEMVATRVPLGKILDTLCRIIEDQRRDTLASVLLLSADGIHLDSVAGPSLPEGWKRQISSVAIGPCAGSCGTAAYRRSPVIVSDITTDPLWDVPEHRAAALSYGLRASWSNPILSAQGKVLGTFCMYYRVPRSPDTQDLDLIELATHLARVAIERDGAEEALRRSESFLAEGEAISQTGTWGWNLTTGKITWSEEQGRMLGFDTIPAEPSLELFLGRIQPEDRGRIRETIESAVNERRAYSMEYRVAFEDGSVKHFETRGRPVAKPSGEIDEYIGITMDVTESKRAQEAVRASEQVARGQVEALVQSLDVLATAPAPDQFIVRMLSTMGRLTGGQWVALWLLDETSDALLLRAAVKGESSDPDDSEHPFVKDPFAWKDDAGLQEMFFAGVPITYEDVDTDPRIPDALRLYFQSQGTRKFVRLPTLVGGEVKGFITIRHAERPPYQPAEIELAQALAHQAMLAIQSRQAATLEERNRMARDIHDTLAQGFTAIVIQLQAADDAQTKGLKKEAAKHLQIARDLARQSLMEARRSVLALRPQALEDTSFWDALKRMIKATTAGTQLQTKFRMRGEPRDLPSLWQENLLHIGQEALTNTLKYARAARFEARLNFNKEEVRLELEDDGEGFTTTDRHDGFGLIGMRERVEQMGGTLAVISARHEGTKVVVVSPYRREEPLQ